MSEHSPARRGIIGTITGLIGLVGTPVLLATTARGEVFKMKEDFSAEPVWQTPNGERITSLVVFRDDLYVATERGTLYHVPWRK